MSAQYGHMKAIHKTPGLRICAYGFISVLMASELGLLSNAQSPGCHDAAVSLGRQIYDAPAAAVWLAVCTMMPAPVPVCLFAVAAQALSDSSCLP